MEESSAHSQPSIRSDKFDKMRNIAGADIEEIRSQIRARHPGLSVHLTGVPDQATTLSPW